MNAIYSGLSGVDGDIVSIKTDPNFNHLIAAASYFTDGTYETIASPIAGLLTIEGRPNGANGWVELDSSPLDCTNNAAYVSTSVPLYEIRVTASGLDSGVHFQLTVTANDH